MSLPFAHLAAWLVLWTVNAGFALAEPWPAIGAWARWLHLAFDLGQALALGLLGWCVFTLWSRFVSPKRRWLILVVAVASVAVSTLTLVHDIEHFVQARDLERYHHALAAAISLGIPGAAIAGALCARPYLRIVAVGVAVAVAVANQLVLSSDYPGAHLYMVWGATTLGSWAMVDARRWPPLATLSGRRAVAIPVAIVAAAGAVASLVVWPPPPVVVDVFQNEGAVLFPYLADGWSDDDAPPLAAANGDAGAGVIHPDWRGPRKGRGDVPPSEPRIAPQRPIVILLSIDSMRAETLTDPALRSRFPHITRIADDGVHFSNARATGSSTRNTLGSLFASKHLSALRWRHKRGLGRHLLEDPSPRLTEELERSAFTTAHVVSYGPLGNRSRITGTMNEERVVRTAVKGQRFALSHELLDVAIPLIERRKNDKLFLFMHWMDAHAPYNAAGTDGGKRESYLRELELCDAQVGRLWDALEGMGVLDRVVFVLLADHGEALGDHGIPEHGVSLYDVLVRVPIVFHMPGVSPRRVDVPVSTLDIAPTLLDLVGAPVPGEWLGQSLVGFLRGQSPALDRPIVGDQNVVVSLIVDDVKVMDDSRKHVVEIYDLKADPNELRNIARSGDEKQQALVSQMRAFFAAHRVVKRTKGRVD